MEDWRRRRDEEGCKMKKGKRKYLIAQREINREGREAERAEG